tara:strand:+ start:253 stop:534 length:282 start_codon:yes stop_codon:yes gene_type:complete
MKQLEVMMKKNPPKFTRQHTDFIADFFGPLMSHPTEAVDYADVLTDTNITFDRKKFEDRAVVAWEKAHADSIEDAIDQEQAMLDREIKHATAI